LNPKLAALRRIVMEMFIATAKIIGCVLENNGKRLVSKASLSHLLAKWYVSQGQTDSFHIYTCHTGSFVYVLPEVKVSLLRITGYMGVTFLHATKEVADIHIMVR
jgi:hypothetical protein